MRGMRIIVGAVARRTQKHLVIALAALVGVTLATFAAEARGATFTVNSTAQLPDASPGDGICATAGGECTIHAAIGEANAFAGADVIVLPTGVYPLTVTPPDITSSLTIRGAGATRTVIDGTFDCGLTFNAAGSTLNVFGIRFFRCATAVSNHNGTVNINYCVLMASRATLGAALRNSAGVMNVRGTTIERTFSDHFTTSRGGIFVGGGTVTFRDSTIRDNLAVGETDVPVQGGAIYCENGATVRIYGSRVVNNRAQALNRTASGGGIYAQGCTVVVDSSSIEGNSAVSAYNVAANTGAEGGGIYAIDSTVVIRASGVTGNSVMTNGSRAYGGGLNVAGTSTVRLLYGSSAKENYAATGGGGARVEPTATFTQSPDSEVVSNYPDDRL